jgi:hypothetical protein
MFNRIKNTADSLLNRRQGISPSVDRFLEEHGNEQITCGFYSIGLIIHLNRIKKTDIFKSAGEYINQFSYDSKNNNAILKRFFRNLPESRGLKILSKLYSQK